jgi:hypothetical protein
VLVIGLAAFALGLATFFVATSIMFAPSGIGNRVLVAGALGAAMIVVALAELASSAWQPLRRFTFASLIAIVSAAALARLEFVERYWAEAPMLRRQVLQAARADLADVPAGSTVILDGVCPYHGPAVVFESGWDVGSALSLALDRQLLGDAVSPRMRLTRSGLDTQIYDQPAHYPYGPNLLIYDPRRHVLVRLTDSTAARRYFTRPDRQSIHCPTGYVGQGVLV